LQVKNLQFAKSLEPDNKDVERKLQESLERRSRNEFTIPSTVAEELKFNPFMRVNTPGLKKAVGLDGASDIEVMQKVRSLKDKF
jgi:hydroxyacylglutathione hydrolase